MEEQSYIMREITPLSDRDCFYIADRRKKEFAYPIHCHSEFELNFTEHAAGVRRVVGDSAEVIGDYDLVLIALRRTSARLPFSFHQMCSSRVSSTRTSLPASSTCWSGRSADCAFLWRPL